MDSKTVESGLDVPSRYC